MHTFVILAYKESKFLEDCIKSVLSQTIKTNVIIATTTDNKYIRNLAKKYNLEIKIGKHTSIGGDFQFALESAKTQLVTIAHQDDIYEKEYAEYIIKYYNNYKDSSILFTDYYEIRNNKKIYSNINLKIKRILLISLKIKSLSGIQFNKRNALRFGNSICCPSVTFNTELIKDKVYKEGFKCNVDWDAWERLSKQKGKFMFINKKLMGHRIDDSTTTSSIIKDGIRTKEDLEIFKRFWPIKIAKCINRIYSKSEKSNYTNSNIEK